MKKDLKIKRKKGTAIYVYSVLITVSIIAFIYSFTEYLLRISETYYYALSFFIAIIVFAVLLYSNYLEYISAITRISVQQQNRLNAIESAELDSEYKEIINQSENLRFLHLHTYFCDRSKDDKDNDCI